MHSTEERDEVRQPEHNAGLQTHAVPGFGRGVWLWALYLISPSVYSVGPDTSTHPMGRGSMCEL